MRLPILLAMSFVTALAHAQEPDPNKPTEGEQRPETETEKKPDPPKPVVQTPEPTPEDKRNKTHAPEWALWTGARVGAIGFGNAFYGGPRADTTGNWVQTGLSIEADVGARLGARHVPYVFYEQSFYIPGRRLDGTGAVIMSRFFGLGFRYTAFDPDTIGFVADVSIGLRTISAYQNGHTFEMSGFETFRLGLGLEIRLSTLLVISPLAYVSGGVLTETNGTVTFKDGTMPPFQNGQGITDQRGYLVFGLGVGAHFDLFGK